MAKFDSGETPLVGYLGPRGTFSEQAAVVYRCQMEKQRPAMQVRLKPFDSIWALVFAADRQELDGAVVPLENSLEGSIVLALDLLAHEVDLRISGEIVVPVRHNLLGKGGLDPSAVTEVMSHPQALGQCGSFLRRCLPQAKQTVTSSTAEAARVVALSGGTRVAIGTSSAAAVYGLSILVRDVQDNNANATRFCVLAKGDGKATGDDKTSLVFSPLANRAGVLHEQLQVFAVRGIDLTRIESRPTKRVLGEYLFFIDLIGHRTTPTVAEALELVRQKSSFFRLLGSYPRWCGDEVGCQDDTCVPCG